MLHGDGIAMACGLEGDVRADELHGLFVGDTRVLVELSNHVGRAAVATRRSGLGKAMAPPRGLFKAR